MPFRDIRGLQLNPENVIFKQVCAQVCVRKTSVTERRKR